MLDDVPEDCFYLLLVYGFSFGSNDLGIDPERTVAKLNVSEDEKPTPREGVDPTPTITSGPLAKDVYFWGNDQVPFVRVTSIASFVSLPPKILNQILTDTLCSITT